MNDTTIIDPKEVYKLAHSLPKKTTKAEAFSIVMEMIQRRSEGKLVAVADLAALYSHIMPPQGKTAKSPGKWVALTALKNDVRYYLNGLYSDGKRLMATDGHRLHIWNKIDPLEFPQGYYDIQLNPIDDLGKYPDIDLVIPELWPKKDWKTYTVADLEVVQGNRSPDAYRLEPNDTTGINCNYLRSAINGADTFTVVGHKDLGGYRIQGPYENTFSVVMPMRLG